MQRNKSYLLVALVLVLALILTAGCGGNKPASTSGSEGNQGQSKNEVIKLKIATVWPTSLAIHQGMPVRWAEEVARASGGRLQVEVYPAGAIVGAAEVLDAANGGTIDGYHSGSFFWLGKMPAAPFFTAVPMTMEPFMHLVWVYEGGGLELWQKMYDQAGYNIKVIPLGMLSPEVLAWSKKPLSKYEDWQGLKYRTAGWWGEILRENKVAVTTLPAAEIYPSMERGVLDAAEFSTPENDRTLSLFEVADYLTGPGIHQPSTLLYLGINKNVWNALPDDLKGLLESTARSVTLASWAKDMSESMKAMDLFKEKNIDFTA